MQQTNKPGEEPPTSLGTLIRAERERQGLSLRQLGELVGVDKSAVSLWEQDETVPKAKHVAALSRALELPTGDLMLLTGAEYPHDAPSLPAMLRSEYDLPPDAIAEVERHIAKVARKYGSSGRATSRGTTKSSSQERRTP